MKNDDMHPGVYSDRVLSLDGFGNHITDHFNDFGRGFLMISVYGADMAVDTLQLAPENLDEGYELQWPEVGIRLNTENLSRVYAKGKSRLGAGTIECDFTDSPNSFSVIWIPEYFNQKAYNLVTEAYASNIVSDVKLRAMRDADCIKLNICPCCRARRERIRNDTANHPVSIILQGLTGTEIVPEFRIASDHVDMLCAWLIREIRIWQGEVTCVGDHHVIRVDVAMIHTIQICKMMKRGVECSVLRCYHSLGGVIFEMSIACAKHSNLWHEICAAAEFEYHTCGGDSSQKGNED